MWLANVVLTDFENTLMTKPKWHEWTIFPLINKANCEMTIFPFNVLLPKATSPFILPPPSIQKNVKKIQAVINSWRNFHNLLHKLSRFLNNFLNLFHQLSQSLEQQNHCAQLKKKRNKFQYRRMKHIHLLRSVILMAIFGVWWNQIWV